MATKRFVATRKYNELYYQFPKVFITSDKYRFLSDKSKIAYMIFRSRLDLAIKRNQVDSNGFVYFEFTEQELAMTLNCSRRSINTIKNELKEYELLEIEDMGFDVTTGKRKKARLYLGELDTTENDVYLLNEELTCADFAQREQEEESLDNSDNFSNFREEKPCAKSAQSFNNSLDYLDTKKTDTKIDTLNQLEEANQWRKDFIGQYSTSTFVPQEVLTWIVRSSEGWQGAKEQLNMIYESKRIIEKRQRAYWKKRGISGGKDYRILGESFAEDLNKMYQRCIQNEKVAYHEGKKIQNRKGFYFRALLNFWECCARELSRDPFSKGLPEKAEYLLLQAKRVCTREELEKQIYGLSDLPKIPLHNWLEEEDI